MTIGHGLRAALAGLLLAFAVGCSDRDEGAKDPFALGEGGGGEIQEQLRELFAQLREGERKDEDFEANVAFYDAVDKLILMVDEQGTSIEPELIGELGATDSWAVRLGILHVLASIGTEKSVEPIMACILDPHPQVSHKAMYVLRGMTAHRIAPEEGEDDGLPAVPASGEGDDAFSPWARWHSRHGDELHARWTRWWKVHRDEVEID